MHGEHDLPCAQTIPRTRVALCPATGLKKLPGTATAVNSPPMRLPLAVLALASLAGAAVAGEPVAPVAGGMPPAAPTPPPAPKITVAQFLEKLPGTWSGVQHMANPKKQVMTMRVAETYRWETGKDGARTLVGELTYTIGSGDTAKTFSGVSRTWVDEKNRAHAEVTQNGKSMRYDALISEDTLVFIPEGKGDKADSGTGVHFEKEGDDEFLIVVGFQTGPDGIYRVGGKLKRAK